MFERLFVRAVSLFFLLAGVSGFFVFSAFAKRDLISITVGGNGSGGEGKSSVMSLFVGVSKQEDLEFLRVLDILKSDLSKSGQFRVVVEFGVVSRRAPDIRKLYRRGFSFVLFIDSLGAGSGVKWSLYDPVRPRNKIAAGNILRRGLSVRGFGHRLSNQVWKGLMGMGSIFTSKLCYIKRIKKSRSNFLNQLCVSDFDGSNERVILSTPRTLVASSWGRSGKTPFIVYSEFTDTNIRLMKTDLSGNRQVIINFDGSNVGVSFSPSGKDVLYCRSGCIWSYKHDVKKRRGVHSLIIRGSGVAASPNLLSNGDIIYCSSGKLKKYRCRDKKVELVVSDGYNVAPAYHEKADSIVYSKRVLGRMQIFVYRIKDGIDEQLTFDSFDKLDPVWSSCGNWAVFCVENANQSHLRLLNVKTKKSFDIFKDLVKKNNGYYYPALSF